MKCSGYGIFFNSPVAMLSVHTNTTIEARIFGICAAGLVGLLSTWAGAHSCGLHCHRYKTHSPTIHHCGCVPHIQNIAASAGTGTLCTRTLVCADLEHADLQERLELNKERRDRANQTLARMKWHETWNTGCNCPDPQTIKKYRRVFLPLHKDYLPVRGASVVTLIYPPNSHSQKLPTMFNQWRKTSQTKHKIYSFIIPQNTTV